MVRLLKIYSSLKTSSASTWGMKLYFNLQHDARAAKPVARFVSPGASLPASSTVTPAGETSLGRNSATQMTDSRNTGSQK